MIVSSVVMSPFTKIFIRFVNGCNTNGLSVGMPPPYTESWGSESRCFSTGAFCFYITHPPLQVRRCHDLEPSPSWTQRNASSKPEALGAHCYNVEHSVSVQNDGSAPLYRFLTSKENG